ncbi:MAG: cysteine/glutathione ABC transporter ATP-binding protein/permease CydC [Desulfobacteraceae bacterium]|nr:cysteine/glutathione ABC transporter ATP-binding protein/permease CydC [Desulfobacteraceae bacterium]
MLKSWRELAPFLKLFNVHLKWMALGILCGLIAVVSAVGLLALSGWFISAAAFAGLTVASAQLFNFFHPGIGVRLFAIGRTVARYAERIVSHDATFRILQSLRSWFYIHLEPLAPARLMMFRSGDILNRIVADIDALDNLYLRVLSPSTVALVTSMLVVAFLWIFDPFIALSTGLYLAVAGFGVSALALHLGESCGREIAQRTSELRVRTIDTLQGLAELLIFDAYHRQLESVKRSSRALLKSQQRMSHIRGLSLALITLISGLAVLTALYLAVDLVTLDVLNGANLALITLAIMATFEAILPLPVAYQYLGRTREAGRRLLEIVDMQPQVIYPDTSVTLSAQTGVTFGNVSFQYSESAPWVLKDVSLKIPAGRRIAVIGETGSGKSTLIHLLVRFWDPASGHIRLDGEDIRNLSEAELRRSISVVSQQPHLFNASLRDNLQIARPGADDNDLWAALESAQLKEFVKSLPEGMDTWVGEAAKLLSGGQARRVALARAMLHDARLWVLDEPTEGLDTITERTLMQAVERETRDRTLLLITHRLVDLHWMDQIVMLDMGQIIAQGSHEELLAKNERYAQLHMRLVH